MGYHALQFPSFIIIHFVLSLYILFHTQVRAHLREWQLPRSDGLPRVAISLVYREFRYDVSLAIVARARGSAGGDYE